MWETLLAHLHQRPPWRRSRRRSRLSRPRRPPRQRSPPQRQRLPQRQRPPQRQRLPRRRSPPGRSRRQSQPMRRRHLLRHQSRPRGSPRQRQRSRPHRLNPHPRRARPTSPAGTRTSTSTRPRSTRPVQPWAGRHPDTTREPTRRTARAVTTSPDLLAGCFSCNSRRLVRLWHPAGASVMGSGVDAGCACGLARARLAFLPDGPAHTQDPGVVHGIAGAATDEVRPR